MQTISYLVISKGQAICLAAKGRQKFLYCILTLCVMGDISAAERPTRRGKNTSLGWGLSSNEIQPPVKVQSGLEAPTSAEAIGDSHFPSLLQPAVSAAVADDSNLPAASGPQVFASSASIPPALDGAGDETRHFAAVLNRIQDQTIAAPGIMKAVSLGTTISDIARKLKAREDQKSVSAELQAKAVTALLAFFVRDKDVILADHGLDSAIYVIACLQNANFPFSYDMVDKILPFIQYYKQTAEDRLIAKYNVSLEKVERLKVLGTMLILRQPKGQRGHSPTTGYQSPRRALATMLAHSKPAEAQQPASQQ